MELTFRQGTADDIPALKSLWKQCFPDDTDSFIDAFFGVVPVTRCLVACKGEPLSVLFLLTATVAYKDTTIPVRYLYAGCTHPEHRRQGIYEKLISYAGMYAASAGAAAIYLHPADDSLREYYKMRGYRDGISCPESRLAKAICRHRQQTVMLPLYATLCWQVKSSTPPFGDWTSLMNPSFGRI